MDNSKFSCIIIDDDECARETLNDFICEHDTLEVIKTISESQTAIKYIATLNPDLVFLDVNMPNKNGISVMNEIIELGLDSKVIFVSSYQEYIMDALKRKAFDYLIKPINKTELDEAILRFINEKTSKKLNNNIEQVSETNVLTNESEKIIIKNSHGSLILKPSDILFLQAEGCYTNINLVEEKTEVLSKNIGSIESQFPKDKFYKISRSVIINLKYLSKINRLKRMVYLTYNNKQIQVKASKEKLYDLESFIH